MGDAEDNFVPYDVEWQRFDPVMLFNGIIGLALFAADGAILYVMANCLAFCLLGLIGARK